MKDKLKDKKRDLLQEERKIKHEAMVYIVEQMDIARKANNTEVVDLLENIMIMCETWDKARSLLNP